MSGASRRSTVLQTPVREVPRGPGTVHTDASMGAPPRGETSSWLQERLHTMHLRLRPSQRFSFVARRQDAHGQWTRIKGALQAWDIQQARDWLARQELRVQALAREKRKRPVGWLPVRRSPQPFALVAMTRRFAVMMQKPGLPIAWVLDALTVPEEDPILFPALMRVQDLVHSGLPLSKAFASNPGAFPPLFANMLQIAERTGNLAHAGQPGDLSRGRSAADARARTAMVYPAVVLFFSTILMWVLFAWLLPPLLDICVAMSVATSRGSRWRSGPWSRCWPARGFLSARWLP